MRDKRRRSIFVDGVYTFSVSEEELFEHRLAEGDEVSPERLEALIAATDLRRAKDAVYRLLSLRAYSEAELRAKLRGKGIAVEIIERALGDFRSTGVVDDRQYAESFVRDRMALRPAGRKRLQWELRAKGVDRQVVEETLADVGEETEIPLALDVAQRRCERLRGEEPEARRRKLALFLQRRGFAYETINKVLDKVLPPE